MIKVHVDVMLRRGPEVALAPGHQGSWPVSTDKHHEWTERVQLAYGSHGENTRQSFSEHLGGWVVVVVDGFSRQLRAMRNPPTSTSPRSFSVVRGPNHGTQPNTLAS